MQKLVLLFLLCIPAFATRIQDTNIRDSSGRMITSGKISVCPPGSFVSGPYWVSRDCVQVSITSGALNITLQPGTYRAHWITPAIEDQQWLVTDSATPLRIQDIVSLVADGLHCGTWLGGVMVAFVTCPTGGGGGTGTWPTLSSIEWPTIDNTQWPLVN